MHEMGIAQSVLDAAAEQLAGRDGARVVSVGLRVGERSGVDSHSLAFCFDCLKADSSCSAAELELERTAGDDLELAFVRLEIP